MKKTYRYVRIFAAVIVGLLSLAALTGIFYPVKIFDVQVTALAQRVFIDFSLAAVLLFVGVLLLTLLFGRIYCSTLCPFGLMQEFLAFIFRRKRKPLHRKSHPYKYFIAAVVFGALIGGTAYLIWLIDPYTLFRSAVSCAYLGIGVVIAVALLVWFKGRMFCSEICPVGALLGLLSKVSYNKIYIKPDNCVSCGLCARSCPTASIDFKNHIVDNETCVKCLKCLTQCPKDTICFGHPAKEKKEESAFSPSRRRFLIGGAALVVLAAAVKGGIELGKSVAAKVRRVILPAGKKPTASLLPFILITATVFATMTATSVPKFVRPVQSEESPWRKSKRQESALPALIRKPASNAACVLLNVRAELSAKKTASFRRLTRPAASAAVFATVFVRLRPSAFFRFRNSRLYNFI